MFGFELRAFEGIAATDVAVRIEPAIGDVDLTQPASQWMADALRHCAVHAKAPGALDTLHTLDLTLVEGRLTPLHASAASSHSLSSCLSGALSGVEVKGVGGAHRVMVQLRRHAERP